MNYDVGPFVKRIYNTPTFMIVAEGDDLTLWDLEINAFNAVPSARKKLHVLPHTSHMTLYSDASKVETAAKLATDGSPKLSNGSPAISPFRWRWLPVARGHSRATGASRDKGRSAGVLEVRLAQRYSRAAE